MDIRYGSHPMDEKHYTTEELRKHYHQPNIFKAGDILLTYSHDDRIIFGGAMPTDAPIQLPTGEELKVSYFLERREMGVVNIGGAGSISIDGTEYEMNLEDGIYIGKGNKEVIFKSKDAKNPAKFYIASSPAHKEYPIVKIDLPNARHVDAGEAGNMNKRTINQYLHPDVCQTCQLSMGLTKLAPASAWNTMPAHTHERRMEVYFYFDFSDDDMVVHLMGQPDETRHIIMHSDQAVISPSWSIHAGVGTSNYSFIWSMCGENQEYTDMDHIKMSDLR